MENILRLIMLFFTLTPVFADWQFTSPGKGFVTCVQIDDEKLYVGSAGNIYLSENKGMSWVPVNDISSINFDYIYDIAIHKEKIFLGTIRGLMVSSDKGKTWVKDTVDSIVSAIWDMKRIGNDLFIISGSQLYKSIDDGLNWEKISPEYSVGYTNIAIDGENIYLGGTRFGNMPYLTMSRDFGKNWEYVSDTTTGLKTDEITAIAAKNGYIYVAGKEKELFISSDKGKTWDKSEPSSLNSYPVNTLVCDDNIVYAGSELGFYYSTDKGKNWGVFSFQGAVRNILVNDNYIYLATDGLGISTDLGQTWDKKTNGFGSSFIFDLALWEGAVYVGTYLEGVFVSYDECESWEQFKQISEYASISKIAFLDSSIYMVKYNGQFQYSNDFGNNWNNVTQANGIPNMKIFSIKADENKNNVFAGNQLGMYISNDLGNSWNTVSMDLQALSIFNILINNEEIYACVGQMGLSISTDYGVTWKNDNYKNGVFFDAPVSSVALCGENIIIGTNNPKDTKGIYISKDMGTNWTSVSDNNTLRNVHNLLTYENFVFAATDSGMIMSSDCGESWYRPLNSLKGLSLRKLLIYGSYLFAATQIGVFKAPLSDFGIVNVEKAENQKSNYLYYFPPYPVPTTNIVSSNIYWDTSIEIENDDIAVYDIFGNKVAGREKITIDKQNAFSGILTWDSSNVPDGIYLIRIIHGTKTLTMKVIVSK